MEEVLTAARLCSVTCACFPGSLILRFPVGSSCTRNAHCGFEDCPMSFSPCRRSRQQLSFFPLPKTQNIGRSYQLDSIAQRFG